jgi:hypothetical protein
LLTGSRERDSSGGSPCRTDARGFDAVLTPAGEAMLRRMWPVYARVLRSVFVSAFDADEAEAVAASLARVGAGPRRH